MMSRVPAGLLSDAADAALRAQMAAIRCVLWRALLEPFVACVFALAVLMCLACVAFGAALNRVVFVTDLQR